MTSEEIIRSSGALAVSFPVSAMPEERLCIGGGGALGV
jgi:hypothetical protein